MKNHKKRIYQILAIVLAIVLAIFIVLLPDWVIYFNIDTKEGIKLSEVGAATIAIIGLILFFIRLQKQQKQIDIQIKQRVDERFNSAIGLLGSKETSARTGAIYALSELAMEEPKYRTQITQILCSHIRSKTNERDYKKEHDKRPSNEIQTTINRLFKKETGLYAQSFAKEANFPKADLSHAYLVGADFVDAQCQGADFVDAQCQRATFVDAQCQGADFLGTQCQGAIFWVTQCQEAIFSKAKCQGASFMDAQCQGAIFNETRCQGAHFYRAQFQGAIFNEAQFQGAYANAQHPYPISLKDRVDQDTELENVVFKGEISEATIQGIEDSRPYLSDDWYQKMQEIIEENKNKPPSYTVPDGCITEVLKNSKKIQAIIDELEGWVLEIIKKS